MDCPDENLISIVTPLEIKAASDEKGEVRRSLNEPIGKERLSDLAAGKKSILLIVSDYTRAVPNEKIIPSLIDELEKAGCKREDITALVANGLHKPISKNELVQFYGRDLVEEIEFVNHDAEDESQLIKLGMTSFKTEVSVNRLVVESDLVIATGLIEPHFFAGYSGGRKSILPGVSGVESICQNHSFRMIDHPLARSGVLNGNPIHEDMVEASRMSGLDYILNVIVDRHGRVAGAFAGDPIEAHRCGVSFLDERVKVEVASKADIVITSNGGYPLDRDLYQAVKGMSTAEAIVKNGGTIIILSECIDGIGRGHETFYELLAEAKSPDDTLERIKREEPIKDQWQAQILARILKTANVIVVTKNIKHSLIEDMHMTPASNIDEALKLALKNAGSDAKIIAVPDGPYVIPYIKREG